MRTIDVQGTFPYSRQDCASRFRLVLNADVRTARRSHIDFILRDKVVPVCNRKTAWLQSHRSSDLLVAQSSDACAVNAFAMRVSRPKSSSLRDAVTPVGSSYFCRVSIRIEQAAGHAKALKSQRQKKKTSRATVNSRFLATRETISPSRSC